jgi:cytochrome c556
MKSKSVIWVAALALVGVAMAGGTAYSLQGTELAPVVKERRAAMKTLGTQVGIIKKFVVDSQGTADDAAAAARQIAAVSEKIPSLFPTGTSLNDAVGETGARPEIWAEFDAFKGVAGDLGTEAVKLASLAEGGADTSDLQAQFAAMGKNGCGTCHEKFRKKLKN